MRKFIVFSFCLFLSAGSVPAQQQNVPNPIQVTKSDLLAFKDIKPFLEAAHPGKDYSSVTLHSFTLTVDAAGTGTEGTGSTRFTESAPCGTLTPQQRMLIEQYGHEGVVFSLEKITLVEHGTPGTPYRPEETVLLPLSDISFTIRK